MFAALAGVAGIVLWILEAFSAGAAAQREKIADGVALLERAKTEPDKRRRASLRSAGFDTINRV